MKIMLQDLRTRVAAKMRAFARANRGNVAMIFAVSLVPLTITAGAGLDFARGMMVRSAMGEALDAAALAVGSTSNKPSDCDSTAKSPSTACTSMQLLAQQYFDANYKTDKTAFGSPAAVTVQITATNAVLSVTDKMPTTLLTALGVPNVNVTASSTVVWGQSKLWVALVLDNSGSMSSGDKNGSKMDALIAASQSLLTSLQGAATNQGDVQVSIVPFVNVVNIGTGYLTNSQKGAIDWRAWEAPPTGMSTTPPLTELLPNKLPLAAYGTGDDCPFDGTNGYVCAPSAVNDDDCYDNGRGENCIDAIASNGLICPSMHDASTVDGLPDRFYNGCYSSAKVSGSTVTVSSGKNAVCTGFSSTNCKCSGSGTSKVCKTQQWKHVWAINNHNTWTGCIMDRVQDYDIANTQPTSATPDTLFPAMNTDSCLAATVTPLPSSWTAAQWTTLSNQINAMKPAGSTNQAIGLAHGWQSLTTGSPYSTPTVPANTTRYIILLSDGLNTQDRWYGNGRTESNSADGSIDTRMNLVCTAAKNDGVVIYTLFVDINGTDGNSVPLQNCASDSTKYFDLTSTSQIATAFASIAQQITNLRVSK